MTPPAPDDLTARARIRDAALAEFAEHGYAGAGIRGIARRAEVSPALVQHHFGTKERLRRACDEHVLAAVHQTAALLGRAGDTSAPGGLAGVTPLAVTYLARSLTDGGGTVDLLFDQLVEQAEAHLAGSARPHPGPGPDPGPDPHPGPGPDPHPDADPEGGRRARAVALASMWVGNLVLHRHLARALGTADDGTQALAVLGRVGAAVAELLDPALFAPGERERLRTAMESLAAPARAPDRPVPRRPGRQHQNVDESGETFSHIPDGIAATPAQPLTLKPKET